MSVIATNVDPIHLTYPDAPEVRLHLDLGVCRLKISPGCGDTWVVGICRDQTGMMLYNVTESGGTVVITTSGGREAIVDLELGNIKPFALTLELAGGDLDLELGGLPISRLDVRQGAGRAAVVFSHRNPVPMTHLRYCTEAGAAEFRKLANTNCAEFDLEGGAVSYRCDFGGTLQRNANARIVTGASSLDIAVPEATFPWRSRAWALAGGASSLDVAVPEATAARVAAQTRVGLLDGGCDWTSRDAVLFNEAFLSDRLPFLEIAATAAVGPIHVHTI